MGFIYLLTSIVAESFGNTLEKINFKKYRTSPQLMMLIVFFVMTVSLSLYIALTGQPFPHLTIISIGLLLLIAMLSFGGNVFDYLSMKVDDMSLREPLVDFIPILAGLVGYVVFPDERKPAFLLAFILGSLIVYWGVHRRKLRKFQKKGMLYLLLGVILYAALPSLYKEVLTYVSPVYLAFFRIGSVFLLASVFFPVRKITKALSAKRASYGILAGVIFAIGAVAGYSAIQIYGVVMTMLFVMLGPALRYSAGYFILKEKVRKGEVVSSLLLTLVVALAALY